ncbi:hydroxypyruvate isomerase family protein [Pseudonocardia phyllosphaerae]|uniref:hydroxypyruvate isomerase family protein n=1 Tax=Pseudonocardia phyllosphaerae TaxID=3390502 RepID=UPI00397B10DA
MSPHSFPLPLTVNCSIVFGDRPMLERPAAAAAAGFERVEFWWPFDRSVPADADVDAFVRAVRDAGVTLTGLNFDAGDMPGGERGILSDPRRATAFADNVEVAVGIGEQLGTLGFNALYGNRIEGVAAQEQDELARENLALAARAAARIGAVALLEPVSGTAAYPITTAAEAVAVLDAVGSPDLKLLLDVYHLAVNGDDPSAAIERYADRIGHVQIADAPGRGEPGTGELPIAALVEQVKAAGYTGPVALEYKPTTAAPFAWLDAFEGARA